MPYRIPYAASAAAIALALAASVPSPAVADSSCFLEWSDAAPVVEREQLTPARGIHDLTRQFVLGDLMRITLCREADVYVYRLIVRDREGRLSKFTVDARRPFRP